MVSATEPLRDEVYLGAVAPTRTGLVVPHGGEIALDHLEQFRIGPPAQHLGHERPALGQRVPREEGRRLAQSLLNDESLPPIAPVSIVGAT